jgi:uncharacterized repeat protein (TIGR01451 family)
MNQNISPNNNFGIVQYDLIIEKNFVSNEDQSNVDWTNDPGSEIFNGTGRQFIESGDTVYYTLDVENAGPAPALDVVVRDMPPANMEIVNVTLLDTAPQITSAMIDAIEYSWS